MAALKKSFHTVPVGGMRLWSEDYFIEEFAKGGTPISKRAFRALCRALKVPMLEVGSTRLVDALTWAMALRAALRVGQPDFLAPGCETLKRSNGNGEARELDAGYVTKHLSVIIAEVLAARQISGMEMRKQIAVAAKKAAERMALAGFQELPEKAQKRWAERVLQRTELGGIPL